MVVLTAQPTCAAVRADNDKNESLWCNCSSATADTVQECRNIVLQRERNEERRGVAIICEEKQGGPTYTHGHWFWRFPIQAPVEVNRLIKYVSDANLF